MRSQPLIDKVDRLLMGTNEVLDLLLGQMVAVARVLRVADLVEVLLEEREVRLGQTDAQDDLVVWVWDTMLDPSVGDVNGLLDLVAGLLRGSGEDASQRDEGKQTTEAHAWGGGRSTKGKVF
jgi:hypothetical protein